MLPGMMGITRLDELCVCPFPTSLRLVCTMPGFAVLGRTGRTGRLDCIEEEEDEDEDNLEVENPGCAFFVCDHVLSIEALRCAHTACSLHAHVCSVPRARGQRDAMPRALNQRSSSTYMMLHCTDGCTCGQPQRLTDITTLADHDRSQIERTASHSTARHDWARAQYGPARHGMA